MSRWPALLAVPAGLAMAAPLAGLDLLDATFGEQPVPIGAGARALGMGGAFSAVADDATAATWNPAGLTQCERPELAASLGWYSDSVDAGSSGGGEHRAFRPDHASGMLPFFAVGCQQVVGVAWQRQFDFTSELDQRSSQHLDFGGSSLDTDDHQLADRHGAFSSLGVCYAIEVHPGLSFGFTVNRWDHRLTRQSGYEEDTFNTESSVLTNGASSIPAIETIHASEQVRVRTGTSVVLGAFWQATPALTVALVVKPGFSLHLDDEQVVRDAYRDPFFTSDTVTTSRSDVVLHHPPSATLGLACREDDTTTIAFDTTCTRWSQYYVQDDSGRRSAFGPQVDPSEFRDLFTFRVGWERIVILPSAVVVPRLGALLEFLPAVSRTEDAATRQSPTIDRWLGATAGLSLCRRSFIYDAGIQVRRGDGVGSGTLTTWDRTADATQVTARLGVTVQF